MLTLKKLKFLSVAPILVILGFYYVTMSKSKEPPKEIIFVANSETMGNGIDASTMDYFLGKQYPQLSLVISHLTQNAQKIKVVDWQDENIDWATDKKVILGTVWGYTKNINKFVSWLDLMEKKNIDMINHPKFLKWNVNKKYLLELSQKNIEIPDTLIFDAESISSFDEAKDQFYKKFGHSDIVIKGVIDAGGFGYMHVTPEKLAAAKNHFDDLKMHNQGAIVQGFTSQVYKKGEFSFVFFDDRISHFFLKVPKYNEDRVQQFYGGKSFHFKNSRISEQISYIKSTFRSDLELTEDDVKNSYSQAELVYAKLLNLLNDLNIPHPKYLRIDGVAIKSKFVVMEIEGIEPYLDINEAMNNDPSNNILVNYVKSMVGEYGLSR